jgi:ribose transport system substrate-binding protein
MRKVLLIAAAALGCTMVQAGVEARAQDFSKAKIDVIVKATTSQYWATVFDGARAASRALGVQIATLGAPSELDAAEEVSIMENAISANPTGIVIAATNAQALAEPIAAATKAGIPVVVIDSDANTDQYVTFLATNNVTGGMKAADEMARCIKARTGADTGKLAYLTALAGAQSLNDRDKGFLDGLKKYPGLTIVEHRVGNNQPSRALSDSEDLLTRHPDLVGLFADNELEGDGAGTALSEKGLGSKVCLVAFDTSDTEIKFVRSGIIDALIVQNPYMMGYAGVWYALAAAHGVVFPHYVDTGVSVVTKANIDSPQMVGLLDPSKYVLTPFLGVQ